MLGHVNIDNVGQSALELYIDNNRDQLTGLWDGDERRQVVLSLDSGATHVLHQQLVEAVVLYKAKAASGVVMNVNTGEIIAAASVPDFDPQKPQQLFDKNRFDRISNGVFELGSVFKILTMAMVLDRNIATLNSPIDVSKPLQIGPHKISDHHQMRGSLSLQDVFLHSSNIGTAKFAAMAGLENHRDFLQRLNLLAPLQTELGAGRTPPIAKAVGACAWGDNCLWTRHCGNTAAIYQRGCGYGEWGAVYYADFFEARKIGS